MNQKSKLITVILCWLFGVFGVHRFYLGKIWTGILYLCTGGLFGIGTFIDMVVLLLNGTCDKQGVPIRNDLPTFVIVLLMILWVFMVGTVTVITGMFGLR